jgi:hypothetical protein
MAMADILAGGTARRHDCRTVDALPRQGIHRLTHRPWLCASLRSIAAAGSAGERHNIGELHECAACVSSASRP